MKIIGYTFRDKAPKTSPFVDEVVILKEYSELQGDYAIDITLGELAEDPRPWLKDAAAYYGDYFDQYGTYSLHSMFPSIRTTYPGMIYKTSLLVECKTKNPLEEICKNNTISYIPRPIFKIVI
jgi:hypothetical protein